MLDFSNSKILIVGDVMLDKYYFGKVDRISPEAPVPIVNIQKEESRLGGASNVANNIVSLGGHSLLCGVIGHDLFGKEIERISRHKNIDTFLLKTSSPTITKARIIGGKQQIVRVDYEDKSELNASFSLIISFIKLALYIALKAHKVNYLRQIKSIYIVEIRQRCSSNLGRIIKYLLPL